MDEVDQSPVDQTVSTQELVAREINERFPASTVLVRESKAGQIFEIHAESKLLLVLDKKGARYFIPSRRKRNITWEKVTSVGLSRLIDSILRDLAEADYEVFSIYHKQLLKRPIHISRYMRCPECKESGSVKIIFRGDSLLNENSELYTPVPRSIELNGAKIKCTLCGWVGFRGQLLKKIRTPRIS
jgi:uncharacterized protein YlaI